MNDTHDDLRSPDGEMPAFSDAFRAWLTDVVVSSLALTRGCRPDVAAEALAVQGTRLVMGHSASHCAFCANPADLAGVVDRQDGPVLVYMTCQACTDQQDTTATTLRILQLEEETYGPND